MGIKSRPISNFFIKRLLPAKLKKTAQRNRIQRCRLSAKSVVDRSLAKNHPLARFFYPITKLYFMNKILLALAAGIGIGLLVAPDKGSNTRKKLKNNFDDLKDQAQDSIDELADNAKHAIITANRKAKSIFN